MQVPWLKLFSVAELERKLLRTVSALPIRRADVAERNIGVKEVYSVAGGSYICMLNRDPENRMRTWRSLARIHYRYGKQEFLNQ